MPFETGDSVRVISEAGTHIAHVLLGGEDRITVDVPGWGVQVFRRAGDRWEPAGLRVWEGGAVRIDPATEAAAGRGRRGW